MRTIEQYLWSQIYTEVLRFALANPDRIAFGVSASEVARQHADEAVRLFKESGYADPT